MISVARSIAGKIGGDLPRGSGAFWALALLLVACFLLGGSSRPDVQSLVVLRPLAIVLLGHGLWRIRADHIRTHRFLFALAAGILALLIIHLIPLPPGLWTLLPGRGLVAEIDRAAGLGPIWRPLTLSPEGTRNALFAAQVPLAVLVLGAQLERDELVRLLPLVLALGGISALLGVIQPLADPEGPLYLYATTNSGAAVGLFANRNHQALLLVMLLPMIAVMASGAAQAGALRPVRLLAILAGLCLLPLILITGSRAGLAGAVIALLALPWLLGGYRAWLAPTKLDGTRRIWPLVLIVLGIGLCALTIGLGRGTAWDRLLSGLTQTDERAQFLPTVLTMIGHYFPAGSGPGSFAAVYQVHEPAHLLSSVVLDHAHNDWLEVILTGGLAGALLLAVATVAFVLRFRTVVFARTPHALSRLGLVLVLLAAVASLSDYPLRVPSLAALFVIATLWSSCDLSPRRSWSAPV